MSSRLLSPVLIPDDIAEVLSSEAWLQALLDVEAALAAAAAHAGVIPERAAGAIAAACKEGCFDIGSLARDARGAGNVVVPLVRALQERVSGNAARYVHWGATSQDILDSASVLVSRRVAGLIDKDLDGATTACARLAQEHRATVMVARTLLQQALPTTFGLKAAGWLVALLDARRLLRARSAELCCQLGGASGTLASLGGDGAAVLKRFAQELGLPEPVVPWHSARGRVAALGSALAVVSGAAAKTALDVVLMSQSEIGEVAEPTGGGRGGSSTMPHKHNPIGSAVTRACALRVQGLSATLVQVMAHEHERGAGVWQAEWEALSDALAYTGGAVASIGDVLAGLEVRDGRMRDNLQRGGGLEMAERVSLLLAGAMGRAEAHAAVAAAAARATQGERGFRAELLSDEHIGAHLSASDIDKALDPAGYLGSTGFFIDRALDLYTKEGGTP